MPDYNSSYTGAQIDSAVGQVLDDTVIKDTAQTLTDAKKTQARTNIGAASEWVLLWENASLSSSFPRQTISIDITGYAQIAINTVRNKDASRQNCIPLPSAVFTVADMMGSNQSCFFGVTDAGNTMGRRFVTDVNASGITISDVFTTNGTFTDYLIPSAIYGRQ